MLSPLQLLSQVCRYVEPSGDVDRPRWLGYLVPCRASGCHIQEVAGHSEPHTLHLKLES